MDSLGHLMGKWQVLNPRYDGRHMDIPKYLRDTAVSIPRGEVKNIAVDEVDIGTSVLVVTGIGLVAYLIVIEVRRFEKSWGGHGGASWWQL